MLQAIYTSEIVPKLMKELNLSNVMSVPKLVKIVVNSSSAELNQNSKVLESLTKEIAQITSQKPMVARAKKSIASFKLREGMPIGLKVTLRKKRMYEFYNRLVNIALPRSRDFKGLSRKGFDGRGNYTFGIQEQIIFPEIAAEKVDKYRGMNITLVTSARTNTEGEALLRALGFPLK